MCRNHSKKENKLFLLNLQGRSGIDQEIESKNIIFEKNVNSSYIGNCEWIKKKKESDNWEIETKDKSKGWKHHQKTRILHCHMKKSTS